VTLATALDALAETFTREQPAAPVSDGTRSTLPCGRVVGSGIRRDAYSLAPRGDLGSSREHEHLLRARSVATEFGSAYVVSHQSAVLVHGLPVWGAPLDQVHITRVGPGTSRRRAGVTTHTNHLVDGSKTRVRDIAVTTSVRALLDLACVAGFESAVCSMDAALRLRLTDRTELIEGAAELRGPRGAGIARRAVAFADGGSTSVGSDGWTTNSPVRRVV
jgi:hypothetical protein